MLVLNIGFINSEGKEDETQLDIEQKTDGSIDLADLLDLVLSLREEMDIVSVKYVDTVEVR